MKKVIILLLTTAVLLWTAYTGIKDLSDNKTEQAGEINDMENTLLKEAHDNYRKLTTFLIENNLTITTMESCTSGLIASFITDIDNSSKVFQGAAVTYSNNAKIAQGVSAETIEKYGVYSKETAIDMAKTAKKNFDTDIAVGITGSLGIADPNNSDSTPGEVYFAIDYLDQDVFYIEVKNQGSKFLNKVYTANRVCLELLNILENQVK